MSLTKPYIYEVNWEDFQQRVIEPSFQTPVLLDLWAQWCAPCLVLTPMLETVVDEYNGALLLAKVEVDEGENMKIAGRYKARGFPTVLLIESGEERGRFTSARPAHFIRQFIRQHSLLHVTEP